MGKHVKHELTVSIFIIQQLQHPVTQPHQWATNQLGRMPQGSWGSKRMGWHRTQMGAVLAKLQPAITYGVLRPNPCTHQSN